MLCFGNPVLVTQQDPDENTIFILILTLSLMSVTCNTLVGPSVSTLTVRYPDPGLSRCLLTSCSSGTPRCSATVLGPSTTSLPTIKPNIKLM